MMSALCHNSVKMSQQNAFAEVQVSILKGCHPTSFGAFFAARLFPTNAAVSLIKIVRRAVNASNVGDAVVSFIAVNVINLLRLLTVVQKPANAVSKVNHAFVSNGNIASRLKATGFVADSDSRGGTRLPNQFAGIGVVMKEISYRIWDNINSHSGLPLSVDRGAVASTTVTPILTRGEI